MVPGWLRALRPRRLSIGVRRLPGRRGTLLILLGSFVVGVGAAWGTAIFARSLVAEPDPSLSPSASPSPTVEPSATGGPFVPVDEYPPITRDIEGDDVYAGLTDLNIPIAGSGVFAVAPAVEPPETDGTVRWVRIEVEDSLPLTPEPLAVFVLSVLNDERGWASGTRFVFGGTTGVAEVRVIFANPSTIEGLCERRHDAALPPIEIDIGDEGSSPSPSPSISASEEPEIPPSCADEGIIVINGYDWAAGLAAFGEDRSAARDYLINHFLGHIFEERDATCTASGSLASVMVDHEIPVEPCRPNGWPNPIVS